MPTEHRLEQVRAASRRWRKNHPEKLKQINRENYIARKFCQGPCQLTRPQRGVTVIYPDGCEDHYTRKDFETWLHTTPCPFEKGTTYKYAGGGEGSF